MTSSVYKATCGETRSQVSLSHDFSRWSLLKPRGRTRIGGLDSLVIYACIYIYIITDSICNSSQTTIYAQWFLIGLSAHLSVSTLNLTPSLDFEKCQLYIRIDKISMPEARIGGQLVLRRRKNGAGFGMVWLRGTEGLSCMCVGNRLQILPDRLSALWACSCKPK